MLMLHEQGKGAGPSVRGLGHRDGSSGCLQGRRLTSWLPPSCCTETIGTSVLACVLDAGPDKWGE